MQVATALRHLKDLGVIHTDLKLNNIMIEKLLANPLTVKVIDFGLAIHKSEPNQISPYPIPSYR